MGDEKEIIGYFTDDRSIYCVECINNNREIMKKIERAITADDTEEPYFSLISLDVISGGINTFSLRISGKQLFILSSFLFGIGIQVIEKRLSQDQEWEVGLGP